MIQYLASLPAAKQILWGYFLWYLVFACLYFEADLNLWLTSVGIAAIVGFALYTNARTSKAGSVNLDKWQTFRFYLTPFCVSSFSALVKGHGFLLIFSPQFKENLYAAAVIVAALSLSRLAKRISRA